MKRKIMTPKSNAKALNNLTYTDYYYRLMLMACSVFKWEGLPENLSEKWIEKYLFNDGECMLFHDDTLGYMVTQATAQHLNAYDEPINLRPVATNYNNTKTYTNGVDAVLICNNDLRLPTRHTVELFSMRLADITRAIDVNITQQKTSALIICSEKQRLSLKHVYQQWNENEPVIYGDKSMGSEPITSIKTDAPIVFDKLQLQKHALLNELYTFLGVNNANQDKKERLVTDEVTANDEQVIMHAQMMLKARQEAAKQINKIFDLNVTVSLRSESLKEVMKDSEPSEPKEA